MSQPRGPAYIDVPTNTIVYPDKGGRWITEDKRPYVPVGYPKHLKNYKEVKPDDSDRINVDGEGLSTQTTPNYLHGFLGC